MIKPDAVESGYIGPILDKITSSGLGPMYGILCYLHN